MNDSELFTPAGLRDDGISRVGRTGAQVTWATSVVGLGSAFLVWRGWLHDGLDAVGFGYWTALLTTAASALMNWRRLRGKL